jgi:hypothetical protein
VDQKSLDIGDECYRASLRRYDSPPFPLYLLSFTSIYPDPD